MHQVNFGLIAKDKYESIPDLGEKKKLKAFLSELHYLDQVVR